MTRFELRQHPNGVYQVLLDGKDVAQTLDWVEIRVEAGELPMVTLGIKGSEVTVSADSAEVLTDLPDPAMRRRVFDDADWDGAPTDVEGSEVDG